MPWKIISHALFWFVFCPHFKWSFDCNQLYCSQTPLLITFLHIRGHEFYPPLQRLYKKQICYSSCSRTFGQVIIPLYSECFVLLTEIMIPELSIYGKKHIISPNFERLAAKSVVFNTCIVQVAVCNPSRNSLLSGLRPDTIGSHAFESTYGDRVMILPTLLKRHGEIWSLLYFE